MSAHCPENGWSCPGCKACSWPNNWEGRLQAAAEAMGPLPDFSFAAKHVDVPDWRTPQPDPVEYVNLDNVYRPHIGVPSQTATPPLVDMIGQTESWIWLAYDVEQHQDGSWYQQFTHVGVDPTEEWWTAVCDAEAVEENERRRLENERLDADQEGQPRPTVGDWIRHGPTWPDYMRTWVDWATDSTGSGWEGFISQGIAEDDWPGDLTYSDESALDFLLRRGIAPGQPFLLRCFGHRTWGPDWDGDYGEEWSCEVIAVGPVPPEGALAAIERAWAYNERAQGTTP